MTQKLEIIVTDVYSIFVPFVIVITILDNCSQGCHVDIGQGVQVLQNCYSDCPSLQLNKNSENATDFV